MKFRLVVSTLLLADSAVAALGTALRAERHRKRVEGAYKNNPINRITSVYATNDSNVDYSSNWAGAILIGTGYTSVAAEFVVPTISTTGSGSAWVGIGGDTCRTAILQTGIDWSNTGSSIYYDAWYEWYPDSRYDFDMYIAAGNTIK
jgi:hypothetical protein